VTDSRRPPLPPGPYLVVGLARSGAAAMRVLRPRGEVVGVDSGEPQQAAALREEGFEVHMRSQGIDLLERAGAVVKSPGVPRAAPVVLDAMEWGIMVIGELELAWRLLPNEFVAVTGTNGTTTTAELLGAIHRAAGEPVAVAGNVGTALAELVDEVTPATTVVCEASSFQLEDSEAFAPEAAVLVNLREDHLDRHGTVEAYRAAKLRAFANQGPDDIAVAPLGMVRRGELPGRARRVSFGPRGSDMEGARGMLSWHGEAVLPVSGIRLRGVHNHENAMAASAAALARGIGPDAVRDALRTFVGVPHRLEEVAERDGVLFVNDSKATNVDSATVGIQAFDGGVHAILGGSLKGAGFRALRKPVAERCKACYLIGEAAIQLARDLDGTVPLRSVGNLERAVREAAAAARPGDVVLLSPACASYDQYRDFEERGDHFRRLVRELSGGE
jgi:UDP-N-acetylmuramoylalanine--D-glutamate ligase